MAGSTPAVGDRLVCLRNDKAKGLLNGSGWVVTEVRPPRRDLLRYRVIPDEALAYAHEVPVSIHPAYFADGGEAPSPAERRRSDAFDFGYALTVHKAQGSQWDDVVLFNEGGAFGEHRARWLYTGLTRAAERITVVQ
jgi:exodeoxyribonuclease-5